MTTRYGAPRVLLGLALAASPAVAQDEAAFVQAFSGEWFVFDPDASGPSQSCSIDLKREALGKALAALSTGCTDDLGEVHNWGIADSRIVLNDEAGEPLAVLGGNQQRITGEIAAQGDGVVLERRSGDARSAELRTAIASYRCLFRGYGDACASAKELAVPAFDGAEGTGRIRTLVSLNARSQPRGDAPVLGVIAPNEEIVVNDCLVASDGLWCRAAFGGQNAWLARTALRGDTWPVATYVTMPSEAPDAS